MDCLVANVFTVMLLSKKLLVVALAMLPTAGAAEKMLRRDAKAIRSCYECTGDLVPTDGIGCPAGEGDCVCPAGTELIGDDTCWCLPDQVGTDDCEEPEMEGDYGGPSHATTSRATTTLA